MLITDTVRGSSLSEDDALHSLDDVFGDSVEPSDIPRLRSIHVTNGYREGIAEGKERSVQAGFDEGYSLGAEFGMTVGWILGVLEALQLVKKDDQTMKLLENAKTELDLANLFNEHYFDDSGIWKYDVDATIFREIAAAHPILKRWKENIIELVTRYGLDI